MSVHPTYHPLKTLESSRTLYKTTLDGEWSLSHFAVAAHSAALYRLRPSCRTGSLSIRGMDRWVSCPANVASATEEKVHWFLFRRLKKLVVRRSSFLLCFSLLTFWFLVRVFIWLDRWFFVGICFLLTWEIRVCRGYKSPIRSVIVIMRMDPCLHFIFFHLML